MKQIFTFLLLQICFLAFGADNEQFYIECPSDVTVDCTDEIWDLSIYGQAYVHGYGDPVPADSPEVNYYLNDCDIGTITRKWTATDYSGNTHSCTQTITVISAANYDSLSIQWPPNYYVDTCTADLSPEYLPHPFNYPKWNSVTCGMIVKNYTDDVFSIGKGCKKVLRHWKLIDWCTYDPNDPYSAGKWEHTQILKVMTTEPPVINCIADVTVSAGSDCNTGFVDLQDVTASNKCGGNISITNNSPYANESGGNASGFYPLGITDVKFIAKDACGNKSDCKVRITVVDKKLPVPICIHGISATLGVHRDGYYVRLYPELFNKGSYDNCTAKEDLQFRVEPEVLTCDDLDTTPVKLYITDEEGNTNYCETYVYLTDNQGKCPPTSNVGSNDKIVKAKGVESESLSGGDTDHYKGYRANIRGEEIFALYSATTYLRAGKQEKVYLLVDDEIEALGYQYTLKFDAEKLSSFKILYDEVPGLSEGDFGFNHENDGIILCSHVNNDAVLYQKDDLFLALELEVTEDISLDQLIDINSEILNAEIYLSDETRREIQLQAQSTSTRLPAIEKEVSLKIFPNPVTDQFQFEFNIPESMDPENVRIELIGIEGRRILEFKGAWIPGYNSFSWSAFRGDLIPRGLYFIRFHSPELSISKKIIKQ